MISSALMVVAWGYFIWTGSISTIWPMFGIANQLLASVALAVGTTVLINMGRTRYAWVTFLPLCFLGVNTLTAGYMSIRDNFWPKAVGLDPALHLQGYIDSVCTGIMMVCAIIIFSAAARRWALVLTGKAPALEMAEG